jgi:Tfp pilus assembly protein PilX
MDMLNTLKHTINNQNGFVLGASILISAILLLSGVLAIWTSNTEVKIVRNESQMIREFYNAEAGVIDAIENYFLTADPIDANNTVNSNDEAGNVVARVEVRCIESTATPVSGLSNSANNVPRQAHIGPAPAGSGYSMKYFEVRRYAVTATSTNGNTQIQVGAWKVFNKF